MCLDHRDQEEVMANGSTKTGHLAALGLHRGWNGQIRACSHNTFLSFYTCFLNPHRILRTANVLTLSIPCDWILQISQAARSTGQNHHRYLFLLVHLHAHLYRPLGDNKMARPVAARESVEHTFKRLFEILSFLYSTIQYAISR